MARFNTGTGSRIVGDPKRKLFHLSHDSRGLFDARNDVPISRTRPRQISDSLSLELTYVTFMTRVLETGMACSEYKKLQEEWASTWKALGEQTAANPITRIQGSEGREEYSTICGSGTKRHPSGF